MGLTTAMTSSASVTIVAPDGVYGKWIRTHNAAIKINEHEPELLKDMESMLKRLAPPDAAYFHNNFYVRTVNMEEEECPNGHSHCQHLFLGASETIPVQDGQMLLGKWQSIFLVELDHARRRLVLVQTMGVSAG